MKRRYTVVDAFSATPLQGNPVAVVVDAEGLDTDAMQRIARWTNLSETTFILPPTASSATHRVRIFTPRSELPFAGHPTLGSAHAAREYGLVGAEHELLQECGAGLVAVRVDADGYRLKLPPAAQTVLSAQATNTLHRLIGRTIDTTRAPFIVDVGPHWIVARAVDRDALLALQPDFTQLASLERELGVTGLTLFADATNEGVPALEVRSFAPSQGVDEDPVCGSGNGAVAAYRLSQGLIAPGTRYAAAQGRCVGRDGRVQVSIEGNGEIWIGGACVSVVDGTIDCD